MMKKLFQQWLTISSSHTSRENILYYFNHLIELLNFTFMEKDTFAQEFNVY